MPENIVNIMPVDRMFTESFAKSYLYFHPYEYEETLNYMKNKGQLDLYTAWKLVLRKWKFVIDNEIKYPLSHHADLGGTATCAFCTLYYEQDNAPDCHGCPISAATGVKWCMNTPHQKFENYQGDNSGYLTALAEQEYDFLFGLFVEWLNSEVAVEFYPDMSKEHLELVEGNYQVMHVGKVVSPFIFSSFLAAINFAEDYAEDNSTVAQVWDAAGTTMLWEVDERQVS